MIPFEYLTGTSGFLVKFDILSFLNEISNEISLWGAPQKRHGADILADFDATIGVRGKKPSELPAICKEFQAMGLPLPSKPWLRMWNELIFDLYPSNSILEVLLAGEVRGSGLTTWPKPVAPAGQRLYGGHLIINHLGVQLSVSLTSIEVQSQLLQDISLGLQALLAIMSNLESADLILGAWRLTLRPGMLYEEIFNGRNS